MSRHPNRRHGRSDDELQAQRDEDRTQWEMRQHAQINTERHLDVSEMTMAKTERRRTDNLITMPTIEPIVGITDSDIARRAYELYEQRGGEHGHDMDDWLQAERELRPALSSTAA